jgi:hypothetical protein
MQRSLVAGVIACGCGGSQGTPPPPPPAVATVEPGPTPAELEACSTAAMRIAVTPPGAGEPAGTFGFRWEGEGDGSESRVVCLTHGDDIELVPRGERREVAIRAHATELQRIVVYDRPHLMAVVPGARIGLADNPCHGYELAGPNTDPWFASASAAYCAKPGASCRDGFTQPGGPTPIEDDLCGPTEPEVRRCVADTVVSLATGDPPRPAAPPTDDAYEPIPFSTFASTAPLRIASRRCGHYMIDTGRETAALVVGSGETWRLAVDGDGRLTGTHQGP